LIFDETSGLGLSCIQHNSRTGSGWRRRRVSTHLIAETVTVVVVVAVTGAGVTVMNVVFVCVTVDVRFNMDAKELVRVVVTGSCAAVAVTEDVVV
jgi:hypothetical protein